MLATIVTSVTVARAEPLAHVEARRATEPARSVPAPTLSDAERAALKEEIKAELLAEREAERRAHTKGGRSVAADKTMFKPGSGFHVESEDGDFALTTRLRVQLLQEVIAPRQGELEQVFQLRRARVQFKGHTFGEHNNFNVELAFSPRDLGMDADGVIHNTPLLSWFIELDHLRDLSFRAGQYKIPYSRQRVVSSADLQLVDRAIANGEFNHDRDIGFDVYSEDLFGLDGALRYFVGVYMGEGRDFGNTNATPDLKLHYLGRVEVLPMGAFKDYVEADLDREPTPKLSLGAAYAFHHRAQRLQGVLGDAPSDGGTTNYHSATADYVFKLRGFSSTGELYWRKGRRFGAEPEAGATEPVEPVPMTAPRDGVGWFVQAGYLFPGVPIEVAARYSGVRGVGERDPGDLRTTKGFTSLSRRDSVGGGVSYYFDGHPMKLQADYFNIWDEGDPTNGENVVRVQVQVSL